MAQAQRGCSRDSDLDVRVLSPFFIRGAGVTARTGVTARAGVSAGSLVPRLHLEPHLCII